jgi:hypothetical protein
MWGNMPEMTLTEAATWAGKSRTTIFKAIRRGRVSAKKNDDGEWLIDPGELARVYQPAEAVNAVNVAPAIEGVYQDIGGELEALRQVNALLLEQVNDLKTHLKTQRDDWKAEREDLRADRDHWRTHAEAQTRLLTHMSETASEPARRSLWQRLTGKG